MKWIATAEHTGGGSVGHPCTRGIYSDPTDDWQAEVEAESVALAELAGQRELEKIVADSEPCSCRRKARPGNGSWWNSVCINVWPQDAQAMAAWIADGADPERDPYGLIPAELKAAD